MRWNFVSHRSLCSNFSKTFTSIENLKASVANCTRYVRIVVVALWTLLHSIPVQYLLLFVSVLYLRDALENSILTIFISLWRHVCWLPTQTTTKISNNKKFSIAACRTFLSLCPIETLIREIASVVVYCTFLVFRKICAGAWSHDPNAVSACCPSIIQFPCEIIEITCETARASKGIQFSSQQDNAPHFNWPWVPFVPRHTCPKQKIKIIYWFHSLFCFHFIFLLSFLFVTEKWNLS